MAKTFPNKFSVDPATSQSLCYTQGIILAQSNGRGKQITEILDLGSFSSFWRCNYVAKPHGRPKTGREWLKVQQAEPVTAKILPNDFSDDLVTSQSLSYTHSSTPGESNGRGK